MRQEEETLAMKSSEKMCRMNLTVSLDPVAAATWDHHLRVGVFANKMPRRRPLVFLHNKQIATPSFSLLLSVPSFRELWIHATPP